QVFEKFSEYLSYTDDVQQALDWLLRHGLENEGVRIMGLDDFLEQLREQIREKYREFNLQGATDEMRDKLEEILDLERDTLNEQEGERSDTAQRLSFLDKLPHALSEAIERLKDYDFADDQARQEFQN